MGMNGSKHACVYVYVCMIVCMCVCVFCECIYVYLDMCVYAFFYRWKGHLSCDLGWLHAALICLSLLLSLRGIQGRWVWGVLVHIPL